MQTHSVYFAWAGEWWGIAPLHIDPDHDDDTPATFPTAIQAEDHAAALWHAAMEGRAGFVNLDGDGWQSLSVIVAPDEDTARQAYGEGNGYPHPTAGTYCPTNPCPHPHRH